MTTNAERPTTGLIARDLLSVPAMEPAGLADAVLYKQAGNAVCVGVIAAASHALLPVHALESGTDVTLVRASTIDPAFAPPAW